MKNSTSHDHAALASRFNEDAARVSWHDETLWWVRQKRDLAAKAVPGWEELRTAASAIKDDVLDNLHDYLVQFEKNATQNGIKVHWARDAQEHNAVVMSILRENSIDRVIKSKSMLTEECHLNEYLQQHGVDVVDSDLGERIIQFAGEAPSHIVMPCIHKKKEEIGELFHRHLGTPADCADPVALTAAARYHLREKFLSYKASISGVNFAVAETGEFVVCTNEGNADMGAHLSSVHIACMGIEKIIPRRADLSVFLRLLARSATGQPITTYSSHFRRPRKGQTMHLVLVDNGRTRQLSRPLFRNSLKCIRCGACMNTCPVYRRSGGHSYHSTVAGPIGAILAPNLDMREYADLPFASTLCGSCSDVCPVKINIHEQLYEWRREIVNNGYSSFKKRSGAFALSLVLRRPGLSSAAGGFLRWILKAIPAAIDNRLNPWSRKRSMPLPQRQTFQMWYRKNRLKL